MGIHKRIHNFIGTFVWCLGSGQSVDGGKYLLEIDLLMAVIQCVVVTAAVVNQPLIPATNIYGMGLFVKFSIFPKANEGIHIFFKNE